MIKTYGCQMNEHDSERLAGLLVEDGMVPADSVETADLVVLNTCCIRENADNRLYGHLGDLKALREQNPDLQIAVGGCLAQKDRGLVLERADHVDVVFGTHNLAAAPSLLRRARSEGPIVEILDAPEPTASGDQAPALTAVRDVPWAAWMTIQTGCDNSCAFCIVPSVRGKEVSRPMDALLDEARGLAKRGVVELTVLGQNVNSYGRDLTRRSPLFASLLRELGAVEGIERLRFTSPHPKDLRDETIAAMAETPAVCEQLHLPSSKPCASTSPCRCSPAATACSPRCGAATVPSATSRAWPPRARRSRTSRSRPTSSSASPARPIATSMTRSRSSPPRSSTAPSRSCSPRARARGPTR